MAPYVFFSQGKHVQDYVSPDPDLGIQVHVSPEGQVPLPY